VRRIRTRAAAAVPVVVAGFLVAACGGSSGAPSNVSEAEVSQALGIQGNEVNGCYALPLTSAQEIETYESAGDTVATNDSGTVGVKTFANASTQTDQACVSYFTDLLNKNF